MMTKPFEKVYPTSIYVHWPFCVTRCSYCDFVALEQHEPFQHEYHEALCREVEAFYGGYASCIDKLSMSAAFSPARPELVEGSQERGNSPPINTLYFGGGTPSRYPEPMLEELFGTLFSHISLCDTPEITIEANPADITREKLAFWKYLGINRLSIGVQCLDDSVLQKLNRRQNVQIVLKAIDLASAVFDNISVDLMLGLPGLEKASWFDNTLATVVTWPITHVSLYFLTIYEKTPIYFQLERKELILPDEDSVVDWYERSVDYLDTYGFKQYEISNFAKKGYSSRHNKAYWDRKPYKGFGLGASSFDGVMRCTNTALLADYIKKGLPDSIIIPYTFEILTEKQIILEELMLGLRQSGGFDLQRVIHFLKSDEKEKLVHTILSLEVAGFIQRDNNRIWLTRKGMILENEIVSLLSEPW